MVAVHPILQSIVLIIVAVAQWQYHFPECLQVGRLLFHYNFARLNVVACTSKQGDMLYSSRNEEHFLGVGAEVEVFLMVVGSCRIFGVYTGMLEEYVLAIVTVQQFTVSEIEAGL